MVHYFTGLMFSDCNEQSVHATLTECCFCPVKVIWPRVFLLYPFVSVDLYFTVWNLHKNLLIVILHVLCTVCRKLMHNREIVYTFHDQTYCTSVYNKDVKWINSIHNGPTLDVLVLLVILNIQKLVQNKIYFIKNLYI